MVLFEDESNFWGVLLIVQISRKLSLSGEGGWGRKSNLEVGCPSILFVVFLGNFEKVFTPAFFRVHFRETTAKSNVSEILVT